jgi:dTDP-4-amino-4,6-dideoxygalactose transaminase
MNVPLLDLQAHLAPLQADLDAVLLDVAHSGRFILGPYVEDFERAAAEYVGAKEAVAVSSGTDALLMALMALDVGPGDLVLVPDFSFFATPGVVARLKATPVFLDIDPVTYNLSPEAVEAWIADNPADVARVKAIIPVHLYGQCADMDRFNAIGCEHGFSVIEDAAQALGAGYPAGDDTKRAGSMGHMGCFSFYPTKNLGAMGEGGLITTQDAAMGEKLRFLRNHGMNPPYLHHMIGGNFRMQAFQGAALGVKLPHLETWHQMRRENAAHYDANLNVDGVGTPEPVYGRERHIYNQYVIEVAEGRDDLRAYLRDQGIGCEVYYPIPFHRQPCFADMGYSDDVCPVSSAACDRVLALPIYPELSREQQDYVIEHIGAFFAKR